MSTEDTSSRRVASLVERLKEDALNPEEIAEIQEIIRNQPRARRRFVELLYLSADLREAIGNAEVNDTSSKVVIGRFGWGALSGLAAAAAVVLIAWGPWGGGPVEVSGPVARAHPDASGIAVITQTSGLEWGPGTTLPLDRLTNGSPVGAGVLEIEEGVVQVDFYSGATVILEGPARLHLESPELGRLDYGNLWAHVPPPARGFRIETSAFEVLDLGTEFGMRVGRDGHGEVHVLDGEVEVHSKSKKGAPERLLTGEGLDLAVDGSSNTIKARPESFAAADRLSGEAQKRQEEWRAFLTELQADPDVLVSYDFQTDGAWSRGVPNLAAAAPADTEGAVVGCRWVEGRWPGKGALEFRNSSHRVRLNLPGTFDDLTLSCWVRVDELNSARVSLLHPEAKQERFVHWTLVNVDDKALHLHFRDTARNESRGHDFRHYHCKRNLLADHSRGQWMHLAVTYDSQARLVSHFLNGALVGTNEIEEPRPLSIGTVDIGNWPYQEWAEGTEFQVRNLNGAIDEFLVVKRALNPSEIARIFGAGRP